MERRMERGEVNDVMLSSVNTTFDAMRCGVQYHDVRLYRVCCVHCMIVCISSSTGFVRVLRVPW